MGIYRCLDHFWENYFHETEEREEQIAMLESAIEDLTKRLNEMKEMDGKEGEKDPRDFMPGYIPKPPAGDKS